MGATGSAVRPHGRDSRRAGAGRWLGSQRRRQARNLDGPLLVCCVGPGESASDAGCGASESSTKHNQQSRRAAFSAVRIQFIRRIRAVVRIRERNDPSPTS